MRTSFLVLPEPAIKRDFPASRPAQREFLANCSDGARKDPGRKLRLPIGKNTIGAAIRLVGGILLEQHNEWRRQHRYMRIEGFAELDPPMIEEENRPPQITAMAT